MALTRNTTSIAKQTTGDSATFVTGNNADPNRIVKWDSNGNAISSGYELSNDAFGGSLPASISKIPTQAAINILINTRLGTTDGAQLGEVKINPTNNPPTGGGGLSISPKSNGEQTITYTPPNVLTAEQIDNTGSDAGEFAQFNAEGNIITSNMKKSITIDSSSTDTTLPTTKATFDYGQNIAANRLLGVDNTIGHGDFLSYNSATGGFETTTASISNHKLFSANHTDVATNVTPSYGDSIYYDGTEWTTGNFGNWGADMEYKGITSQTGATFSDLSYDVTFQSGETTQPANLKQFIFNSGFGDAFPSGTLVAPNVGSNLSGNFSPLGFSSEGAPVPVGANPNRYTLSGKIQFPISGLVGAGLNNSRIRGVYIKSKLVDDGTTTTDDLGIYVIYPDGSRQPLLTGDYRATTTALNRYSRPNIQQTIFVPINEGQTQLQIEFGHDHVKKTAFEIIGALCTKRVELSPEVDHIQIVGSQDHLVSNTGYVDETTGSYSAANAIWSSVNPTIAPANNWSGVFPIAIPDNVSKTVIRTTNSWNQGNSSHEESDHITITIDWDEETIVGSFMFVEHITGVGFLYENDLVGEKTFTTESAAFETTLKFELNGRSIVKLPCPAHLGTYYNLSQKYTIENYKTIASTSKRLEKGFTTLATDQLATVAAPISGTVDTDGYLIVTANFVGITGDDDFAIDIGGTVFENANRGTLRPISEHETLTLPIAAGETYSITSSDGTTFGVRFKAKSTEISDSNSFNLIDSGATGTFEITAINTFEELDLSHIVGTNKTLVVMEVFGGSGSPSLSNLYLKTNGSGILPYQAGNVTGNGSAAVVVNSTGAGGTVTVMTDVNGKVAYMGEATGTVYYKVQGYQGVVSAPNGAIAYTGGESTTLPNGLIMKFGSTSSTTLNYGTAFPTGTLSVTVTGQTPFHDDIGNAAFVTNTSASGFTIGHTHTTGPGPWFWQAIGH